MVILFDLDDTLIDHTGAAAAAVHALHRAHGALLDLDIASFTERWLVLTEETMEGFARGELTILEQRRLRVRRMFQRAFGDAEADAVYRNYLEAYQRAWQLFPDVRPCLEALRGRRLGIVTNGGREQQKRKLRSTSIDACFEVVLTPEPPLRGKPAPDLFFAAAAALRMHPRDCVYVGDHLERDVIAAEHAGMSAVWLRRVGASTVHGEVPAGAQRITSLAELASLL